jgi:uncharacterized LabA/DUF88 family protein
LDRCALFVDANYALAEGALAVHGTRNRDSVSWDYAGLLKLFGGLSRDRTGLQLLRCYWYDTAAEGARAAEHDALADIPGLKLRLSKARPSRKEGVESEIRKDLTALARNHAVSDVIIVSAEEDLGPVIAEVQDLGIRAVLLHIATDGNWATSRTLRQECDDIIDIGSGHLRPYVDLISGAEPQLAPAGYREIGVGAAQSSGPHPAIEAPAVRLYPSPLAAEYEHAGQLAPAGRGQDQRPDVGRFAGQDAALNSGAVPVGIDGQPQSSMAQSSAAQSSVAQASVAQSLAAQGAQATAAEPPASRSLQAQGTADQAPREQLAQAQSAQPQLAQPQQAQQQQAQQQLAQSQSSVGLHAQGQSSVGPQSAVQQGQGQQGQGQQGQAQQRQGQLPQGQYQQSAAARDHMAAPGFGQGGYVGQETHGQPSIQQAAAFEQHRVADDGRGRLGSSHAGSLPGGMQEVAVAGPGHNGVGQNGYGQTQLGQTQLGQTQLGQTQLGQNGQNQVGQNGQTSVPGPASNGAGGGQPGGGQYGSFGSQGGSGQPGAGQYGGFGQQGGDQQVGGQHGGLPQGGGPQGVGQHRSASEGGAGQGGAGGMLPGNGLPPNGMPANGMPANGMQAGHGSSVPGGQGPQPTGSGPQPNGLQSRGGSLGPSANGMPGSHGGLPSNGSTVGLGGGGQPAGLGGNGISGPGGGATGSPGATYGGASYGGTGYGGGTQGGNGQGEPGPGRQQSAGAPNAAQHQLSGRPPGSGLGAPPQQPAQYGLPPQGQGQQQGPPSFGQPGHGQPGHGQLGSGQSGPGQPGAGQPGPGAQHRGGPGPSPAALPQNGMTPLDGQRPPGQQRQLPAGNGAPYSQDRSMPYGGPMQPAQFGTPAYGPGSYGGQQPAAPPLTMSVGDAVQSAHAEGFGFGEAVARDAPALWLEAVLARKPRMPSDLEARLLQGSALPIDSLLHDEVRHALRRGFWDALERTRH